MVYCRQVRLHWTCCGNKKLIQQEKGRKFEDRYATVYYKFMADDVEYLSETKNDSKQLSNRLKWVAYKDMYFLLS